MLEPFSTEQILEVVGPHLRGVIPQASSEGRRICRAMRRGTLVSALRLGLKQILGLRRERSQEFTERLYDDSYAERVDAFDTQLDPPRPPNSFRHGRERLLLLPPSGLFSVYLATLEEVIVRLKPASVCEVGFGSGKNLIYLAARFPDIRFSGYELTRSGVRLARHLRQGATLPPNLARLVGRTDGEAMAAISRIEFHQGDARDLPAADRSVDLTFTVLALEQMWPILPRALGEIRRVTRTHVVFLEAFRDVNDWLGYLNLLSRNYFRASVREVAAAGFRPLALLDHFPNKHTFRTAALVAEVVSDGA